MQRSKHSSIFSDTNELGSTKNDFILKFGKPFNKDLKIENEKLVENLYYIEIIDRIAVTTRFTFVNDTLVEQANVQLDFESQEIKRLERGVRRSRLRSVAPDPVN